MRSTLILAVIFAFCASSFAAPTDLKSPYILEDKHTVPYSPHDSNSLLSTDHHYMQPQGDHYTGEQVDARGSYASPQHHSSALPLGHDIYSKEMIETSHVPSKEYVKRTFISHAPQVYSHGNQYRPAYTEGYEPSHPSQFLDHYGDSSPVDYNPHKNQITGVYSPNHDHYDQTDIRNLKKRSFIGVDAGLSVAGLADVHGLDNYAYHYNKRSVDAEAGGTGKANGHDFTKRTYGPIFGSGGFGIGAGIQVGYVGGSSDAHGHDYKKRSSGPRIGPGGLGYGGEGRVGAGVGAGDY